MTATALDVTLTEEEVVAVAAILGAAWPTPFSLRSPVDADEAPRVVRRGALSLAVRGLVESDPNGVLTLGVDLRQLTDSFSLSGHLAMYSGVLDQPGEPVTPIVYVHDSDQSITLVEAESSLGTRMLSLTTRAAISEQASTAARSVFDGEGTAEALHIARVHDGRADVVTASKGRLTESVVRSTGSETLASSPFWDAARIGAMFDRASVTP